MSEKIVNNPGAGIYIQADTEGSLDRVTKLLAGIGDGAQYKAIGSALKRAASAGETVAAKALTKEYHIKQQDFRQYTSTRRGKNAESFGKSTVVEILYRGYHIPLIRFDTRIDKNGRIEARVKRSSARETFNSAFVAKMGGHLGVYERIGEKRFPVRELTGPATPQMILANDEVSEAIAERVNETFEKRLDHEITAILNGWRKK